MRNIDFLADLLNSKTPSGYEIEGTSVWKRKMLEIGLEEYSDKIGNSGFKLGNGLKSIMISGHIDEIAMMVGSIDEDGMIVLKNIAGVDQKVLPGSQLLVLNDDNNWIPGVIHKAPIHVEGRGTEADMAPKIECLKFDIGADSKKEVNEDFKVYPGSLVVFSRNSIINFGKNKIVGNALDDKIAVYITAIVAQNLHNSLTKEFLKEYTIWFVSCTQEESGLRGATVAAHNINPDVSIDIDVTFATNGGLVSKNKFGDIKLGEGPVIEYGQDKSRRLAEAFIKTAQEKNIKFQRGVSRCGGTNTDAIQLNAKDCETMLISIPNLSMHTQNETCDWRDIEGAINLITNLIIDQRI